MRMTVESTSKVVEINGVPARVWEGTSERGVKVICFITRVAVERSDDCGQFEAELAEQRPPSAGAQTFPARMVLD